MQAIYSALAPPPCRGFIIKGYTRKASNSDEYYVDVMRHPILGVITRKPSFSDEEVDVLPVYLEDGATGENFSGGLTVFCPEDQNHLGFRVVWCIWPESEDEYRLAQIDEKVRDCGQKLLDAWSKGDPEARRRCARGFGDI